MDLKSSLEEDDESAPLIIFRDDAMGLNDDDEDGDKSLLAATLNIFKISL